jgi:hypothetical protein
LKWNQDKPQLPDIFIVPSKVIAENLEKSSRPRVWIMESQKREYQDRWDLIEKALKEI